jgi:hypothetical protein
LPHNNGKTTQEHIKLLLQLQIIDHATLQLNDAVASHPVKM